MLSVEETMRCAQASAKKGRDRAEQFADRREPQPSASTAAQPSALTSPKTGLNVFNLQLKKKDTELDD